MSIKDLFSKYYACDRCGKHISTNLRSIRFYESLVGIFILPLIMFEFEKRANISEFLAVIYFLPIVLIIDYIAVKFFIKKVIN